MSIVSVVYPESPPASAALKPAAADAIRFVSKAGNDANDGLSLGTAKATIQAAINSLPAGRKGEVRLMYGTWEIAVTLWVPSNVELVGAGGRSMLSVIKRANGMYHDAIVGGTYTGVNVARAGTTMDWDDGTPFTSTSRGAGIALRHLYIDGNGANAGRHPGETAPAPTSSYRGSGIWLQWIDGVTVEDVWTNAASNDGCMIYACRTVRVSGSIFSNNVLVNPAGGDTRNGLTIAGTWSAVAGQPSEDELIVDGCWFINNENLGCAIQARDNANAAATNFGGSIIVSNCLSRANAHYGLAIEAYDPGTVSTGRPVRGVIVSNFISVGDGEVDFASVGVSYDADDVMLSNVIVRDAGHSGIIVSGRRNVSLDNVLVDGYGLGATHDVYGIQAYDGATGTPERFSLSHATVRGGAGRAHDTYGLAVSGFTEAVLDAIDVEGTTYVNDSGGSCIYVASKHVRLTNWSASLGALFGLYVESTVLDGHIAHGSAYNNGKATSLGFNRNGVQIADGSTADRRITMDDVHSFDNQGTKTQQWGFVLPTATTDEVDVHGCSAWGNLSGPRTGGNAANHRVWGNSFPGNKAVTGSRGGNAALASLLTQLAALGIVVDSTTP